MVFVLREDNKFVEQRSNIRIFHELFDEAIINGRKAINSIITNLFPFKDVLHVLIFLPRRPFLSITARYPYTLIAIIGTISKNAIFTHIHFAFKLICLIQFKTFKFYTANEQIFLDHSKKFEISTSVIFGFFVFQLQEVVKTVNLAKQLFIFSPQNLNWYCCDICGKIPGTKCSVLVLCKRYSLPYRPLGQKVSLFLRAL